MAFKYQGISNATDNGSNAGVHASSAVVGVPENPNEIKIIIVANNGNCGKPIFRLIKAHPIHGPMSRYVGGSMAGPTSRNQAVPRNAASVITDCLFSFCPNSKVVARAVRARTPLKPSHPAG